MASQITNVVVAGPNGSLGRAVIDHLQRNDFNVTLLTRSLDKTQQAFPGSKVVQVDYNSSDGLSGTLRQSIGHQDALVILINRSELEPQMNLLDAAIAVNIRHIMPSSFGVGTNDHRIRSLPVFGGKVKMEDYISQKADEGHITFTAVQTGAFFDWALDRGVFLNTKNDGKPTMVSDGGDVPFSVTTTDDIGKAVAMALLKSAQVPNRSCFVHSVVITQNQLLAYAKEAAPHRELQTLHLDTAKMEEQAWEKYNNGERGPDVMRGFMPRATFGHKVGLFERTDNDLLGVEQWDDGKVRAFVGSYFKT